MNKVLITGANSGLGVHLVSKFTDEKYEVFEHKGRKHYDLSLHNDIKLLADDAKKFKVNILINNAAIVCPSKKLSLYSESEIRKMVDGIAKERKLIDMLSLTKNELQNGD
jgi:short-subunit dehydrogenase